MLIWLVVIFLASTQLGAEQVTLRGVVRILKLLMPQMDGAGMDTISKVNYVIRKCAHMTEYAILALLTARAIQFGQRELKPRALFGGFGVCLLYASTDELHQMFVPGRTAAVRDVIIDCFGAFMAVLALGLWFALKNWERILWQRQFQSATSPLVVEEHAHAQSQAPSRNI